MSFKDLISHEEILRALKEAGYETPTPVQIKTIPHALEGVNLQVSADTGTGKTAAFLLPTIVRLMSKEGGEGKGPRVLVLVPTRELAIQVADAAMKYTKYLKKVKTVCIYGGAPFSGQIKDLARHHEILVATPGRLIDHIEQGRVSLSRVETFILDEADRMLDIEFIEDVEKIAADIPENSQTLMFSATLRTDIVNTFKGLLRDSVQIEIEKQELDTSNIEQVFHFVRNIQHKYELIEELLNKGSDVYQAIVFTATKLQADELTEKLSSNGESVDVLHGGMKQRQRTRTINKLRMGKIRVLVATDVAARGIDIPALSHVINFDLPRTMEDYEHRIGRTGRAGASGIAISYATKRDIRIIRELEKLTNRAIAPNDIDERSSRGGGRGGRNFSSRGGPQREERSFGRSREERPAFGRSRGERPSFSRDREERPSFSREREERPSFSRDREERPFPPRDRERPFEHKAKPADFPKRRPFERDRAAPKFGGESRGRGSEGSSSSPFERKKVKPFGDNFGPRSRFQGDAKPRSKGPKKFVSESFAKAGPQFTFNKKKRSTVK